MSFKILYVTATRTEADSLNKVSDLINLPDMIGRLELNLLVTGVGAVATAWAMKQWVTINGKPDLAINGGIAGSYKDEYIPGDVVMPVTDCFGDTGIEDGNNFFTLYEAGLISKDEFPYKDGLLHSDVRYSDKMRSLLRQVRAITVNTSTGSEVSKIKLLKKFNPDIETMEGATFFYICCMENIPFLALRAISNRVELRNKDNWKIALALNNLSEKLVEVLLML